MRTLLAGTRHSSWPTFDRFRIVATLEREINGDSVGGYVHGNSHSLAFARSVIKVVEQGNAVGLGPDPNEP
jgi:hypothetical protein